MWGEALFSFQSWLHKGLYFEVWCRNVIASYKAAGRSSLQMNTQLLLPELLFPLGEREGGCFTSCGELGPHVTWWSFQAVGWLLWHPVGQVTEHSQKSLISTQVFTPSNPCDSPFGWYHCSSSQQITTNKPALPEVTGLVTGCRWQSVWGYLVCQCWTAASFLTRHNSPMQFWLTFLQLLLHCWQQCQKNEDAEEQEELDMAEQSALLEELPFKCLPSSSRA